MDVRKTPANNARALCRMILKQNKTVSQNLTARQMKDSHSALARQDLKPHEPATNASAVAYRFLAGYLHHALSGKSPEVIAPRQKKALANHLFYLLVWPEHLNKAEGEKQEKATRDLPSLLASNPDAMALLEEKLDAVKRENQKFRENAEANGIPKDLFEKAIAKIREQLDTVRPSS